MPWSSALVIIAVEIILSLVCGKMLIPCFRKLKTGRYDIYLGSRFEKDGSEPKFGGVIIALSLIVGTVLSSVLISWDLEIGSGKDSLKIIAVVIFSLMFMLIGIADDWLKDVRKKALGLRLGTKLIIEFIICFCFLLWHNIICGEIGRAHV